VALYRQTLDTPLPCLDNTLQPGAYAVLAVSDTGPGLDPERAERFFQPFVTGRRSGGGTGLGLPTVQRLTALHGGGVNVVGMPGHGTVFLVHLPVDETAAPEAGDEDEGTQ